MPETTMLEYAQLAQAVYNDQSVGNTITTQASGGDTKSWTVHRWRGGAKWGKILKSSFQGMILGCEDEYVCTYAGSAKPGAAGSARDWCIDDVSIAIHAIPTQAVPAAKMAKEACDLADAAKLPLTLLGHSLGGGLAQLVGMARGHRFVTFNAPGMKNNYGKYLTVLPAVWIAAQLGIKSAEALEPKKNDSNKGLNIRLSKDPIAHLGDHLGEEITITKTDAGQGWVPHLMSNLIKALKEDTNGLADKSFADY